MAGVISHYALPVSALSFHLRAEHRVAGSLQSSAE